MMKQEGKQHSGHNMPDLTISDFPTNSLTNSTYSATSRAGKFIPAEFKNKHIGDSPTKLTKMHKNSAQFFQPFSKKHNLHTFDSPFGSQKSIKQKRSDDGKGEKKPKVINIEIGFPKLRQTKSTQCQSPKVACWLQPSRLDEFQLLRKLGGGRFGDVFLVRHRKTGFLAALKLISKQGLVCQTQQETEKAINQQIRQIKLQSFLNHPALIALYACFSDETNVYLLLELATDGHLYAVSSRGHRFSEEATSIVVREIAGGVKEMHKKEVIHRDIKLENIVMSMEWQKFAILDGQFIVRKSFDLLCAEHPYIFHHRCLLAKIITKRWIYGPLEPLLMNFLLLLIRSKQKTVKTSPRQSMRTLK